MALFAMAYYEVRFVMLCYEMKCNNSKVCEGVKRLLESGAFDAVLGG